MMFTLVKATFLTGDHNVSHCIAILPKTATFLGQRYMFLFRSSPFAAYSQICETVNIPKHYFRTGHTDEGLLLEVPGRCLCLVY